MLRQVVRGARWYQHVAHRSPSIMSLSRSRAFSVVTPRSLHYGGKDDKIRFYEQDTRGSKIRKEIDPEAEDSAVKKDVENELSKLDRELEILKEGPFGPNSAFIKELPEKERQIALEALRKHAEETGETELDIDLDKVFDGELDAMLKEEFEGLAMEEENWQLEPEDEISPKVPVSRQPYEIILHESQSHPYVDKLNICLSRFANDPANEQSGQELWRWYRRSKQVIPNFLQSIPEEAMTMIWDSQANGESGRAFRATRLQTLAEDAVTAGRLLPTPRMLSYIQSLQESGNINLALDQWEAHQADLCQSKEDLETYWKLGVRLFAAAGDPQRAQDIALAFLSNDKSREPRILLPVITAWGRQPGKEAEVKAWALYLQLKTLLGANMTMKEYDYVSIGLLKAGRLNLAIAVFKDMMVTGQDPTNDSTSLYKAALGLVGNLQASSIREQDVNKISLSTLTVLPRRFQNRFFYASWMKKLIGMGEVDSAAMVIELMYERGVRPDPKHLNGVMAAWLREGNSISRAKAEKLGWSMVQQRIDLVWARTASPEKSPQLLVSQKSDGVPIPKFMQRQMPPANIETFSILLLHYSRRTDDDMVKYLVKCLGDARIQPNSYFMNHLLYAELRKQDVHSVWSKYQTMSASIKPDLETFACLWDCGKLQYDRGRTAFDAGFPSARELYAEMIKWYTHLSPRGKSTARDEFSKELYDQIIRCFCLSKDLPGTLVALYSMGAIFGSSPDEVTARLIALQVARMAAVPTDTPKRRLRRLSTTPRSKENIAQVNRLVEILSERKAAGLQAQGLHPDHLEPHEKQQYQLEIMADLLRVVMRRTAADPSQIEDEITTVAAEMGVSPADIGSSMEDDNLPL
ncbi:pentatricopeptide repeat protein [Aspergillus clavatus NRRL 1]|uniref:Pentatricopeptide repeat protein n=1 Tax=Aspergillus clavatus (strain ATCC 1007 / CBS 513.65 / DSM 816 / NCTC 3887 / NRRL 1 / QM 1276 / 107) TaxID=344612 RepID=A1C3W4_ASPCL|nr:pentatricopeptide repeat protein [Aspergillus clavatus NRRL 1]EAW15104.1 pentatricopeptide repeat protein [Aspergillus clavatus NRRL 1]